MSSSRDFRILSYQNEVPGGDGEVIVSIDYGTSRTGVIYGTRRKIKQNDLELLPLERIGVIGENDKKTLTAILLNRNRDYTPIAFG